MHKECPVCNKKVPKRYIKAHEKYHWKKDTKNFKISEDTGKAEFK